MYYVIFYLYCSCLIINHASTVFNFHFLHFSSSLFLYCSIIHLFDELVNFFYTIMSSFAFSSSFPPSPTADDTYSVPRPPLPTPLTTLSVPKRLGTFKLPNRPISPGGLFHLLLKLPQTPVQSIK